MWKRIREFTLGFALAAVVAGNQHRSARPVRSDPSPPPKAEPDSSPRHEIGDADHIFAYHVIADVEKRSVDAIRFLDALIFAVLAAQAAIYVLYVDKSERFGGVLPYVYVAVGLTFLAFLPTLAVADVPNPVKFRSAFPAAPRATRETLMDQFIAAARWNQVLRNIKLGLFFVALMLTLAAVRKAGAFERTAVAAPEPRHAVGRYWTL